MHLVSLSRVIYAQCFHYDIIYFLSNEIFNVKIFEAHQTFASNNLQTKSSFVNLQSLKENAYGENLADLKAKLVLSVFQFN